MLVTGSSAPPEVTQIGLPACALPVAIAIGAISVSGPTGCMKPSAVSRPPPNSLQPATRAQKWPGLKSIDSSHCPVPSGPGPSNAPNSF